MSTKCQIIYWNFYSLSHAILTNQKSMQKSEFLGSKANKANKENFLFIV